MNEHLATRHIIPKLFNISLVFFRSPTEETDVVNKGTFSVRLRHAAKNVLFDLSAGMAKYAIFGTTVGKYSIHDEIFPNDLRLSDFVRARNVVICSRRIRIIKRAVKLHGCRQLKNHATNSILL